MKKLVCILMLSVPSLFFAQQPSLGISGGYTTNGFAVLGVYYHGLSDRSDIHISLYFSVAESKSDAMKVPYNDLSLNIGYYYKILQDRYNRFHLSLGLGGLVGYEIINNGDNELPNGAVIDGESQLIYGGFVGGEAEYALSDTFSLILVANEFYHVNSDLGNTSFYGGLGIKYTLY